MSKTEKKNPAPSTKGDEKKNVVTLKDGTVVKNGEAFTIDKDGTVRKSTGKELAEARNCFITCKNAETGDAVTYATKLKRCDNGNILIGVATAEGLADAEQKCDAVGAQESNDMLTLVGRGNALHAAFAVTNIARAWLMNFGQEHAFRLVRLTLDPDKKEWFGLFVPAMSLV